MLSISCRLKGGDKGSVFFHHDTDVTNDILFPQAVRLKLGLPRGLSGLESTCQFRRCRFHPMVKKTHSSIPAWRIPWTEEPELQSMGSQRSDTTEDTCISIRLKYTNKCSRLSYISEERTATWLHTTSWMSFIIPTYRTTEKHRLMRNSAEIRTTP